MQTQTRIFYHGDFRYHVDLVENRDCLLSSREGASLYIADLSEDVTLRLVEGQVFYQQGQEAGQLRKGDEIPGLVFYSSLEEVYFDVVGMDQLSIGNHASDSFFLAEPGPRILLYRQGSGWRCEVLEGQVYHNNRLQKEAGFNLELGDEIAFRNQVFKFYPDQVSLRADSQVAADLAPLALSRYAYPEDYPDYHRSPRIIYRPSEEKLQITPPSAPIKKPEHEILRTLIPPLLMIGITLVISIFQPRGLYILMTVAMSLSTMVFSVLSFFKGRRKYQEDVKERKDSYEAYLLDKAIQFHALAKKEREGQLYHYPDLAGLDQLTKNLSHRIYEKRSLDFDFLHYRLGLGQLAPSYQISYPKSDQAGKKDPLEARGFSFYQEARHLSDMPIVANLRQVPLAYVGPRTEVLEQVQLMIYQLAVFHSYHDLQFIVLHPEEEREKWAWMRWLPHATLQSLNVRGFVYNQRSRDQVLNSLNQILKARKTQLENKEVKESSLFHPHYVVVITDETLVLDHVIMDFFSEDPSRLGCSLVFVEDVMSSLSENVQTVIEIKDSKKGQLLLEEGQLKQIDFELDHFPPSYDKEVLARRLAPLKHLQNLKSSIPESVSFLDMYGVEKVEELQVANRWQEHAPYQSLAVPIGLRGKDDKVSLDLHEKAHGPHGLVAGTTGSGKSEMVQSYILSLAVNFHPHDVAFLLIDYKGGGMANLFKDLPHLLGTITNLDGNQSMRALASINAELKRRQRLFRDHEVNHINQYQKKVKLGQATEPLPHLFLISDEFAELKSNQPDFMKELVSTARIGRSLGIHLILATQKPTGVVDDQIWSNSRFKIALKVADRSDSMEMLKTADAAEITQVGRAYLQVGNNEIYELFQSAYSGAPYQADKDQQGIEDETIYLINELGQYQVLNKDLSGLEEVEDIREVPSELDVIVEHIQENVEKMGIQALPEPWLPPLSGKIFLDQLHPSDYKVEWKNAKSDLEVSFALADLPQEQKQERVTLNLSEDGNILLYGMPGTGKSTFLQTLAMDMAKNYSPAELHMYIFDFGTNAMAPLADLPHVADLFRLDQAEKIEKFVRIMEAELSRRKNLLSIHGVGSMSLYRDLTGNPEPMITIFIDSFEGIKDESFENDLYRMLLKLSREGLSVGIHLLMTAGRQINLRATLYSNFKHQLTLKQNDTSEIRSIVGSSPLTNTMDDIKGRGLMKRNQVDLIQIALPVEGGNTIQLIEKLREEITLMNAHWKGRRPESIPMVPEELLAADFMALPAVSEELVQGRLPLGLDLETVDVISWVPQKGPLHYVASSEEEMNSMTNYVLEMSAKTEKQILILAPPHHLLPEPIQEGVELVSTVEKLEEMIAALAVKIDERIESKENNYLLNIVIYNLSELVTHLSPTVLSTLVKVLERSYRTGYMPIVLSSPQLSSRIDSASKFARGIRQSMLAVRINDQQVVSVNTRPLREQPLEQQVNYLVRDGVFQKIKTIV